MTKYLITTQQYNILQFSLMLFCQVFKFNPSDTISLQEGEFTFKIVRYPSTNGQIMYHSILKDKLFNASIIFSHTL